MVISCRVCVCVFFFGLVCLLFFFCLFVCWLVGFGFNLSYLYSKPETEVSKPQNCKVNSKSTKTL